MKIHSSYAHNIDLSEIVDNQQSFRKMADVLSEKNLQADEVHISDEGMQAWKNHVQSMNPQVESSEEHIMTAANTNEVEFEHYSKMMDMSGDLYEKIRKDEHREVNLNDIMKSMMDTYETLYNDIVKAHENGDREVNYKITGKQSISLEQDLAGLNKAFDRRLNDIQGYITSKQVTKQLEGSARSVLEYHKRLKGLETESIKESDDYDYVNTEFKDSTIAIMKQARENFLLIANSGAYKKGIGVGILTDIMAKNNTFKLEYQKLFS